MSRPGVPTTMCAPCSRLATILRLHQRAATAIQHLDVGLEARASRWISFALPVSQPRAWGTAPSPAPRSARSTELNSIGSAKAAVRPLLVQPGR